MKGIVKNKVLKNFKEGKTYFLETAPGSFYVKSGYSVCLKDEEFVTQNEITLSRPRFIKNEKTKSVFGQQMNLKKIQSENGYHTNVKHLREMVFNDSKVIESNEIGESHWSVAHETNWEKGGVFFGFGFAELLLILTQYDLSTDEYTDVPLYPHFLGEESGKNNLSYYIKIISEDDDHLIYQCIIIEKTPIMNLMDPMTVYLNKARGCFSRIDVPQMGLTFHEKKYEDEALKAPQTFEPLKAPKEVLMQKMVYQSQAGDIKLKVTPEKNQDCKVWFFDWFLCGSSEINLLSFDRQHFYKVCEESNVQGFFHDDIFPVSRLGMKERKKINYELVKRELQGFYSWLLETQGELSHVVGFEDSGWLLLDILKDHPKPPKIVLMRPLLGKGESLAAENVMNEQGLENLPKLCTQELMEAFPQHIRLIDHRAELEYSLPKTFPHLEIIPVENKHDIQVVRENYFSTPAKWPTSITQKMVKW